MAELHCPHECACSDAAYLNRSSVARDQPQRSSKPILAEGKPRKVATIRFLLPGRSEIEVRGCGRSVRSAATRALLTLLGKKHLRRQRIANLHMEISVSGVGESGAPSRK